MNGIIGSLPWWAYVIISCTSVTILSLGISTYLHRSMSHKSVVFHPLVAEFFRFLVWLKSAVTVRDWIAVHRWHHAATDKHNDPHSPVHKGVLSILFFGFFHYRRALNYLKKTKIDKSDIDEYGIDFYSRGAPNDWIERNLYAKFRILGLVINAIFWILMIGPLPGIILWVVDTLWMPGAAAGIINGIGHSFGYRNYNTNDHSRNIFPVDILFAGELQHNNHHHTPLSPKLSHKWWEIDFGWVFIWVMNRLGLVQKINPIKS